MARIDYWYDPAAPAATSMVPSVAAAVRNVGGQLLLIHKIDNDFWALPGGAIDLGESALTAAAREVLEETGVPTRITGLVGIYSDPRHVMAYTDGEVRQEFSICFHAVPTADVIPRPEAGETSAATWVDPEQVDHLRIHPAMRLRISHALTDRREPHLG